MNQTSGWGFPALSKKAHWFAGAQSLCGKWLFTGSLEGDKDSRSIDNCQACWKRLHPEERKKRDPTLKAGTRVIWTYEGVERRAVVTRHGRDASGVYTEIEVDGQVGSTRVHRSSLREESFFKQWEHVIKSSGAGGQ